MPHPHIATVPSSSGASACVTPVRGSGAMAVLAGGFPPRQLRMACYSGKSRLMLQVPKHKAWPSGLLLSTVGCCAATARLTAWRRGAHRPRLSTPEASLSCRASCELSALRNPLW